MKERYHGKYESKEYGDRPDARQRILKPGAAGAAVYAVKSFANAVLHDRDDRIRRHQIDPFFLSHFLLTSRLKPPSHYIKAFFCVFPMEFFNFSYEMEERRRFPETAAFQKLRDLCKCRVLLAVGIVVFLFQLLFRLR